MVTTTITNIHRVSADSMADIMVSTTTTLTTQTSTGIITIHIIMVCPFIILIHGGTDHTTTATGVGAGTILTITTTAGDITTTIGAGDILTTDQVTAGDTTTDTGTDTVMDIGMATTTECMATTIITTTAMSITQAMTHIMARAEAA
ncbi:hypothetical protein DSECCO2_600290 [anaerobic digester metagenome]